MRARARRRAHPGARAEGVAAKPMTRPGWDVGFDAVGGEGGDAEAE